MNATAPSGYSKTQITLHWAIAGLVVIQFLIHDGMEAAFDASLEGQAASASDTRFAWFHVACGVTIFVLALWRVGLRLTRGVPPSPAQEPVPARWAAKAVHLLIYVLIIGMPISGSVAWFLGVEAAGDAHGAASNLLFALVALHLLGVLAHFFLFKSNVPARMVTTHPGVRDLR